jgi:3-oxoacyl-[acyl-carrier-protein] synthase III
MSEVSCFIPDNLLDIEEIGEKLGLSSSERKVFKKIYGLEKIPIASHMEPVDFHKRPVEDLLKKTKVDPLSVKYLIHAHTAKVNAPFGDSIVRRIKKELNLINANAFGTAINNCVSVLMAFDMANKLLKTPEENAIIMCGDIGFTRVLRLIPHTSILGDASIAVLVNKNSACNQLLSLVFHTDGKYAKGIWMGEESKLFEMHYATFLSDTILAALKKINLKLDQVKLILPHNVNLLSWQRVAKQLTIPVSQIYLDNIKKYSHCFGADPFINYCSAVNEKRLSPGDLYVVATVGLGAVFAAAVFKC